MKSRILLQSLVFLFSLAQLKAETPQQASFFEKHAEGWHWYEEQEPEASKQESGKKIVLVPNAGSPTPDTPTQQIEKQRKELETKLHAAIIAPTQETISRYLLAQKALMDQSQRFSEVWKQVVMTTPALDESLVHPIDQNARHVYYDLKAKETKTRITALSKEYGLFFFFRQNCPYCHGFAPLVKRFSEKYGWSVLAISLDGGGTLAFPHAKRDNGTAERLNVTHVPALIAVHPQTGKVIPLAYGMISESEIESRVEILTRLAETQSLNGRDLSEADLKGRRK